MKIEITGNLCVTCKYYTQYYEYHDKEKFRAIDCGRCGMRQNRTRPGNRCRNYVEAGMKVPPEILDEMKS